LEVDSGEEIAAVPGVSNGSFFLTRSTLGKRNLPMFEKPPKYRMFQCFQRFTPLDSQQIHY
jgi:hypothetical protein